MQVLDKTPYLNLDAVEAAESGLVRPGNLLLSSHSHSGAAERFRLLAHRLHRARTAKPIQSVLITSAIPSEGKSTVALNLATTIAMKGARTLVIDSDMRRPDLHRLIGARPVPGLSGVLRGEITLEQALRRIDPLGLYYLPAGNATNDPLALLEGPSLAKVLKQAREVFEWIILDSAPLNPLADSQCIASVTDAILLVVCWGYTPKAELNHAIETLEGLPLLGMVMNRFDERQHPSYSSYYSHTGAKTLHLARTADTVGEPS